MGNFLSVTADTMTLFLMASGVTLVIMMGGIDLSVQAVASMTSCILAVYLQRFGILAIPLAVLGGVIAGFAGGLCVDQAAHPVLHRHARGQRCGAQRRQLVFRDQIGRHIPGDLSANLSRPGPWAMFLGVPNEIWVGVVFMLILTAILQLTPFGRLVRGIGAQERAVIASGIDVDRIKIAAYTLSGTMAGVAGVVMAARLGSGSPTLANEFLLPAIACIVVGGTAITGGVGSIWRTFVGALIVQVVRIGMTFMGVSVFAQQIVFGFILVAAVAVTMDRAKVLVIK